MLQRRVSGGISRNGKSGAEREIDLQRLAARAGDEARLAAREARRPGSGRTDGEAAAAAHAARDMADAPHKSTQAEPGRSPETGRIAGKHDNIVETQEQSRRRLPDHVEMGRQAMQRDAENRQSQTDGQGQEQWNKGAALSRGAPWHPSNPAITLVPSAPGDAGLKNSVQNRPPLLCDYSAFLAEAAGVLCMETIGKIRRRRLRDGESISALARDFQLSRNAVKRYLKDGDKPVYRRNAQPKRQLGAWQQRLDE